MSLIAIIVLVVVLVVVWRLVKLVVRLALLLLLIGAGAWYASDTPADAPTQGAQTLHVADGDTLTVSTASGRERVRLLGIDSPESLEHPARATGLRRARCGRQPAPPRPRRHTATPDDRPRLRGRTRPLRPAAGLRRP
jgi:hypothetical protein